LPDGRKERYRFPSIDLREYLTVEKDVRNERESIDTSKQLFFFKKSLLVSFHFINADIITLHSLAFSSSFSNRRSFEDDQASVEEESKRCKLCSTGTD